MERARQILENHFGDQYPKLEKWEFFNHILNAMNEYKNEGNVGSMIKEIEVTQSLLNESGTVIWKDVIKYLNHKADKKFRFTNSNKRVIEARLKEGFNYDELCKVIDDRVGEWICDKQMNQYLRPATLFQASKFEGYLNNPKMKELTGDDNFTLSRSDEPELL